VYLADCEEGLEIFRGCTIVFGDGFESGDTSVWSRAVL
jgi:hypothetical protein